jgi:hypothetical protein
VGGRRRPAPQEVWPEGSTERQSWETETMKNGGNEAKKYLKTNDITFLDAVNCARFTRKFAQIEP